MRLRGSVIGALNLFHIDAGEMREADVLAAQAFADVATIAVLQHRAVLEAQVLNEQLNFALNSRIVIEQAKGVLSERAGLNMEQSFAVLRNHARNHNLRLVDVAQDIIDNNLAPDARAARLARGAVEKRRGVVFILIDPPRGSAVAPRSSLPRRLSVVHVLLLGGW